MMTREDLIANPFNATAKFSRRIVHDVSFGVKHFLALICADAPLGIRLKRRVQEGRPNGPIWGRASKKKFLPVRAIGQLPG
jgi:hypothetical protein